MNKKKTFRIVPTMVAYKERFKIEREERALFFIRFWIFEEFADSRAEALRIVEHLRKADEIV